MKNTNILIGGLLIAVLFLIFQVIDMKKEINNMPGTNPNRNVSMSGGLDLNQLSNASGSTADGFWLYKEDEKQVYYFRYDKDTNEIKKIKLSIY
ncbi:hypothetical protein [Paenibacillus sp. YAF4_2]|uniref:hypothetical protein n=1 Tax=Paenibacillus sp. YAF4_2 TaxID=3233085 RepID=UPI003F9A9664